MNAAELLARRAAAEPDFHVLGDARHDVLTLGDLDHQVTMVASSVIERTASTRDRVALLFPDDDWCSWAAAYLGVLRSGRTAVVLQAGAADQVRSICDELSVTLLIHGDALGVTATGACQSLSWSAAQQPSQARIACPTTGPENEAQILFTSGASGEPKPVVACRANIEHGCDMPRPDERPPDICLHFFGIGTNASIATLVSALNRRQTVISRAPFSADGLEELLVDLKPTAVLLAPTMANWLERTIRLRGVDVAGLATIVLTGSSASPALIRRLASTVPAARLVNSYTSTEAYPARVSVVCDAGRPDAVGLPVDGTAVEVRDDDGRLVEAGRCGRIWLRSPVPPREVLGRHAADASWVATGDVGRLDEDGYLYVDARGDRLVKVGDRYVALEHVEQALESHPDVIVAAVVADDDAMFGKRLTALVVTATGAEPADWRHHLSDLLAAHEMPSACVVVTALPTTASGKVRYGALGSATEIGDVA